MLHVLPSSNLEADAMGALPAILHIAVEFRGGHGGSLLPRGEKKCVSGDMGRPSNVRLRTWPEAGAGQRSTRGQWVSPILLPFSSLCTTPVLLWMLSQGVCSPHHLVVLRASLG